MKIQNSNLTIGVFFAIIVYKIVQNAQFNVSISIQFK